LITHTITYTNTTGKTLRQLPLVVPPLQYSTFLFESVDIEGHNVYPQVDVPTLTWTFALPRPLAAGETIHLKLQYQLVLKPLRRRSADTARPMVFGYAAQQTNLVDWYPFVPAYDRERGWIVRRAWPFGEFLVYPQMSVYVDFTYPAHWKVATNMQLEPCPERHAGRLCGTHVGRGLVLSLSPYYQVHSHTIALPRRSTPVHIEVYAFGGMDEAALRVLTHAQQALTDFSRWFGPYHRDRLQVVVAAFPFSMEYDGLVFVRKTYWDAPSAGLDALTVHEIAHQWWFAQVGNDQALHPWMDESLATFSEWLYLRHRAPDRLAWWDTGRWNGQKPRGYIDGAIYDYSSMLTYREAVYHRGAMFWRAAYEALGEAELVKLLSRYVQEHQGQIAWPHDLLDPLARQWPQAPWDAYFRHPPQP